MPINKAKYTVNQQVMDQLLAQVMISKYSKKQIKTLTLMLESDSHIFTITIHATLNNHRNDFLARLVLIILK